MQKNFCEQKNILPRRRPGQDIFLELSYFTSSMIAVSAASPRRRPGQDIFLELSYFTSSMIAVSAASPRRTPVRMMRV